ncbi:MAG: hypothetical protein JGK26_22535 [Microcoleus sp. PH2017_27_LUM_O_A]|uniref:hypothetical protein n=1 Tax=Microcoleus sp. PH2017_27_LUM_O_A TaxID=2798837 RepID=UPI001E081E83|nr:hypothetical protein [Microcoleus sp. PH2017_27_LUM_O_A]MCC3561857.1 hypothetical protein [Microcoleus sp. PH2017_27_LUM_O_A]
MQAIADVEGRRKKQEGRSKKEEGRSKKEEARRKKQEGRRKKARGGGAQGKKKSQGSRKKARGGGARRVKRSQKLEVRSNRLHGERAIYSVLTVRVDALYMPNTLIEDCSSVFGVLRGLTARKTGFTSRWQRHREQVLPRLVEVKFNPAPVTRLAPDLPGWRPRYFHSSLQELFTLDLLQKWLKRARCPFHKKYFLWNRPESLLQNLIKGIFARGLLTADWIGERECCGEQTLL